MIGIIGAMDVETNNIIQSMTAAETKTVGGFDFTCGFIGKSAVVCATSGYGKVNSAVCTQSMILGFNPDVIINTGIAGSLSKSALIYHTVIATSLVQYDIDTTYFGDPYGLLGGLDIVNIECDKNILKDISHIMDGIGVTYITGVIATGDSFVAENGKKEWIKNTFNAVACDMEGCAVAQTCRLNNVKFAVIRTVSDCADGESGEYEGNKRLTAEKSTEVLLAFIKSYNNLKEENL